MEQELRKKALSTERIYGIILFIKHYNSTVEGVAVTSVDTHCSEDELAEYDEKEMVGLVCGATV